MKKILFTFICSFIALGWVGCEPKPGPGPDPEPEPDVPTILTEVLIDSAYKCCGIDSFAVKSPWVQQEINRFMTDTAIGFLISSPSTTLLMEMATTTSLSNIHTT